MNMDLDQKVKNQNQLFPVKLNHQERMSQTSSTQNKQMCSHNLKAKGSDTMY